MAKTINDDSGGGYDKCIAEEEREESMFLGRWVQGEFPE